MILSCLREVLTQDPWQVSMIYDSCRITRDRCAGWWPSTIANVTGLSDPGHDKGLIDSGLLRYVLFDLPGLILPKFRPTELLGRRLKKD